MKTEYSKVASMQRDALTEDNLLIYNGNDKVPVTEIESASEDGLQEIPLAEIHNMAYDDVLLHLGEFGRYQKRIYLLLCFTVIPCAFHKLAGVFLGAKSNHRCELPFESDNATYQLPVHIQNMSYPWDDFSKTWSMCKMYDANYTEDYFKGNVPANNTKECDKWIFDKSKYKSSSVIEFLLVCDRAWLRATADSLFMTGVLIGSYIFGDLSDRFGRRPTFFISLVLQLASGLLAAIAPEYITFVLARVLIGATTSGVFLVAYVIAMEMVGPGKRLFAGTIVHMFFSIGFLLIAGFAYALQDNWRIFQVVITLVPGILFMSYWWVIPESSRWLMTKGKHAEAKEILMKAAKENKVSLTEDMLDNLLAAETMEEKSGEEKKQILEQENSEYEIRQRNGNVPYKETTTAKPPQPSILDLMRHPSLRKRSINIFFNWFVNSLAYYGLSWSTSNLGGNDYLNFCLSGIMEFPGYGVLIFTLNRFGRKFTLCGALLIGGTALLLTLFVPSDMNWLTIVLAMIGKLAITSSYGTVYVFSTEQFPTVIRNAGLGACSMSARVGGIMAPYINLLADYWSPLPLLIFGGLALLAGGLALLLPETLNRKLPETIADGENFCKQSFSKSKAAKELKLRKVEENAGG
ncbi:hypothetical protein RUM44_004544 [Polyplax serrata]|uniref:Major facilitator superfamily (MFS) profile domain-containing protein n=1 Tax=Polyplax serrata TaxID=468196 RepID=A0ABR1B370_POLSC